MRLPILLVDLDRLSVLAFPGECRTEVVKADAVAGRENEAMTHPCLFQQQPGISSLGIYVHRQHLQPEVGHFVFGAIARAYADRRVVRIARVDCGVVVNVAHVQDRALGNATGSR